MSALAKPRAVLYLRQSIAREESISMELQEDAGRRYCEQQGYLVVAVEADEGISGRTWLKRPAVQRAMGLIEQGNADVIVLWKWSRLSRARLDWAIAIDKAEAAGGRIESATEQVDVSTSTGRFARGMLAEFAAFESERIGDTWKEAQARRASQGLPHTGAYRFGYTYHRDTGFTPDPVTGPILAECFKRYNRGEGLTQLLAYLVGTGVPTSGRKDAGDWTTGRIGRLLRSPFAAGYVTYNGQTIKGAHEPLIDEATWDAYLANSAARAGTRKPASPRSAYSGLLICSTCKHKLYQHNRIGRPNTFTCSGAQAKHLHTGGSIQEAKIETAVRAWLATEAAKDINTSKPERQPAPRTTDATAMLRRALVKEQARLDSLTAKYVDDVIPREAYERLRDEITAKMDGYQGQLRSERVRQQQTPVKISPDLVRDWPELPQDVRRGILNSLLDRIVVTSKRGGGTAEVVPKWEAWSEDCE